MRFNELFTRNRKTEPSSVILLRIFIMIVLISSLTGYITILIIEVTSDEPVLTNTIFEATEMPIPDMQFHFVYPFILQCLFIRSIKEITFDESCKEYLEQPKASSESNNYIGYFKNVQNLTFVKPEIDENAIKGVMVVASIVDPNYNATESHDLMKFNALYRYEGESNETIVDKLPAYVKEFSTNNLYLMSRNQMALVEFTRIIRETIIPNFKDHLGIEPSYYRQGYILPNNIQSYPVDYKAGDLFVSSITLTVQNFIIKRETEQRTRTLLSVFGLVGGAWSLATAFYAALFGVDMIRPWGCVQLYCCGIRNKTHNKLKKTLPVIPLVTSSEKPPPSFSRDVSRDEHAALQQRVDALEVFLREYVVDVNYLEDIKKKENDNDENDLP
ncbi:6340_t:CDS:2 [Funneliformis geosporum]|nr:6340_t:CDS:2 [Funneliformis geosporum]